MNRLEEKFNNKKAFIPFVVANDPDIKTTIKNVKGLADGGADIIEIGIPFSDPVADGPVIQKADLRALNDPNLDLDRIFYMIDEIRKDTDIPLVFLTYLNIVLQEGYSSFVKKCYKHKIDGLIIPDLPFKERDELLEHINQDKLSLVSLLTTNNNEEEIKNIATQSKGFIYLVSSLGVTGERSSFNHDLKDYVQKIKSYTDTPVSVGFGIHEKKQASKISEFADGIIIGSGCVKIVEKYGIYADNKLKDYAKMIKEAIEWLLLLYWREGLKIKFITNDNVILRYDDFNQTAKKVIILLSGIGSSRIIWEHQISVLIKNNYRVINLDARNQGDSQRTKKGRKISKHALDLRELIEKLEINMPILIGNSMGASTIYAYLSLFGTESIKGVISIDQSPKMINTDKWEYGYKNLSWGNFPDYMRNSIGKVTYQKINDSLTNKLKEQNEKLPYDEKSNLPLLIDHAFQDWRSVIYNADIPMLFIAGDKSPLFNCRFINILAEKNVNIKGVILKNVGHIIMAENSKLFNNEMINFTHEIDHNLSR